MRRVSAEQELIDQAIVSTYMDDFLAAHTEEWSRRFRPAADRVEALYAEFTPGLNPQARRLGTLMGAGGMAFIELRYGTSESDALWYGGRYEADVLAIQHNAVHSWNFMRNMFRYACFVNAQCESDIPPYDETFFARAPHIAACHDGIMGNGRGHDERQAALFAGHLLGEVDGSLAPDKPTMAAIEATTWDAERQCQLTYPEEDWPLYRTAAKVADLLTSTDPYGAYESLCVILEDMTKRLHNQALTLVARERGFNLRAATMEERLEFIDHTSLRPLFAAKLASQAAFLRRLPLADPAIKKDFSGYLENADLLQQISDEFHGRSLDAGGVLAALQRYALVAA